MRYIQSEEEIKETINKIVRYSDPDPNKELYLFARRYICGNLF